MPSLTGQLRSSIHEERPFGPATGERPLQVSGSDLRTALLASSANYQRRGRLHLRNVVVSGPVELAGCEITPRLWFESCEFGGPMELQFATLADLRFDSCEFRETFSAEQLGIRWNLHARDSVFADGADLVLSHIEGQASLDNSTFEIGEAHGTALLADGCRVDGALSCDSITANGEARFLEARIGGQVSFVDAHLKASPGPDASALTADSIVIGGSLFCPRVTVDGELRLAGGIVGSQISLRDASLNGHENGDGAMVALFADAVRVRHDFHIPEAKATGEVRLPGAKIGGQLSFDGAELTGRRNRHGSTAALVADQIEVGENIYLIGGFTAHGSVDLISARISGHLRADNCRLEATDRPALDLRYASVHHLKLNYGSISGVVDLRGASTFALSDTVGGGLPTPVPGSLRIDNFTYQALEEPLDAATRIPWIEAAQVNRYLPGPYLELASAYRRIGREGDGRKVMIAGERRAIDSMPKWGRRWLWNELLWVTTGSGFRNWLAALWLIGLVGAGTLLFWIFESEFAPLSRLRPAFNPLLYAIDATVPVLEVGQQHAYAPSGWIRWVSLFLTIAGYVLVTAVVAATASVLNRERQSAS